MANFGTCNYVVNVNVQIRYIYFASNPSDSINVNSDVSTYLAITEGWYVWAALFSHHFPMAGCRSGILSRCDTLLLCKDYFILILTISDQFK